MEERRGLDLLLEKMEEKFKQEKEVIDAHFKKEADINTQVMLRLISLSEEIRALSAKFDVVDYNTQWVHTELAK